jgi:uncharacterized protein (TIGR02996 family)
VADLDALWAECVAHPDDDAPRLVWADAVGGERGELVVLQCALARGGLPPPMIAAYRQRERELVAAHGARWSGLSGLGQCCVFRRGFVDAIAIDAARFAERGAELVGAAPLLASVQLDGLVLEREEDTLALVNALVGSPAAVHVRGILMESVGVMVGDDQVRPLEDQALELLLRGGALDRIRSLGLGRLSPASHRALIDSGVLGHVDRLCLPALDRTAAAVLGATRGLRALTTTADDRDAFYAAFPSTLRELQLDPVDDDDLVALAASPVAAVVERLSLSLDEFRDPKPLEAFPRLRSLRLDRFARWTPPAEHAAKDLRFAALTLPALRELDLDHVSSPATVIAIAEAFGPQLDVLDLRGFQDSRFGRAWGDAAEEARSHVAGELLFGERPPWAWWRLPVVGNAQFWSEPLVWLPAYRGAT